MNNTDNQKTTGGEGAHEQHGPNQKTTGGEPMYHEQHGPNQKTTGGELRCS